MLIVDTGNKNTIDLYYYSLLCSKTDSFKLFFDKKTRTFDTIVLIAMLVYYEVIYLCLDLRIYGIYCDSKSLDTDLSYLFDLISKPESICR